jgi:hypothetical protein
LWLWLAGDYALLRLIDGQLNDFGVAAIICAGASIAAGVIGYADDEATRRLHELARQRRKVVAQAPALGEWPDEEAATAHDQQCPPSEGAYQISSESTSFSDRERPWGHSRRSWIRSRRDHRGVTWDRFWSGATPDDPGMEILT